MKIKLLVSEANGKYLYEPKTVAELEHILGAPVVLLKKPIYALGLGCVINVFRTVQALNIRLEVGTAKDDWGFIIRPENNFNPSTDIVYEENAWRQIRNSHTDYPLWSQIDYEDVVAFFKEIRFGGGWPSKTGNLSGSGRYNNV
jgi:hypothetical protein